MRAAIWGTTVGYRVFDNSVEIERNDGHIRITSLDTFNRLYFRLDEHVAAMKDDCIEYVAYDVNKSVYSYPEWYIDAVHEGWIVNDGYSTPRSPNGNYIFLDRRMGEMPMSPEAIVLRNYMGELIYMEPYQFGKYYDTLEG